MRDGSLGRSLLAVVLLMSGGPSEALPKFAREYGVSCQTCHSVAPRLTPFGLAFQANHYNWPGGSAPGTKTGSPASLISGLATFSQENSRTDGKNTTAFRSLELFAADGFRVGGDRHGGFFVNGVAATTSADEHAGDLAKAFVALPIVGRRGQWALTAGQFTPLTYQWDANNQLTESSPAALAEGLEAFSLADPVPGVRAEFFDRRGEGTADGNYLTVGVPFGGQLALNRHARLSGARGAFVHAFHRHGWSTVGAFGYTHAGNHLAGVIGTYALRPNLYLLGVGSIGNEDSGHTRHLSVEGEYVAASRLALTARIEAAGGQENDIGAVAAVTYYPLPLPVLRLTAELTERKADRSFILFARGQF
jgi:hypothetical protein